MTAAVELQEVTKAFGQVGAVCGVTLDVQPGELVTVIGPSGCGKSTLLNLVAGLEAPDTGQVRIGGRDVAGATWVPPERRRVGMVFQDQALFPHLTVAENVGFGLPGHNGPGTWRRPLAGLAGRVGTARPTGATGEARRGARRRERQARVRYVLTLVQLEHLADRHPHELSGGEQQRVALARALAPGPDVVLLDEPFSSLDETLRARVRHDTVRVLREAGATALLVTHDQTEALAVGDRVCVVRDGVVEQVGPPPEVFARPRSRFVATFMGDADFLPAASVDGVLVCELGAVSPGTALTDADVVLRPHEVALTAHPGDAPGDPGDAATQHCRGEVVAVEYQGAFALHTVRLPSGRTVRSWQPHPVRHAVGEQVAVSLVSGVRPRLLSGGRPVEE